MSHAGVLLPLQLLQISALHRLFSLLMWWSHLQAGKDRLRALIGDAHLAASLALKAAPAAAASVAVGSAAQSGMASAAATPADAERADDAGTPQRPASAHVGLDFPGAHLMQVMQDALIVDQKVSDQRQGLKSVVVCATGEHTKLYRSSG
jgi:hypothetical protein